MNTGHGTWSYETWKMINEQSALAKSKIKQYENYFADVNDIKTNFKSLRYMIDDIINSIKSLSKFEYNLEYNSKDELIYRLIYKSHVEVMFRDLINFLNDANRKNEKAALRYNKFVFPEYDMGNILDINGIRQYYNNIFVDIRILKNEFNRIHLDDTLPMFLRNCGIGKQIYLDMINENGYISSTSIDITLDAEMIWDSIFDKKDVYSFLNDKKVITFSDKFGANKIINILLDFYSLELKDDQIDQYFLDDDFSEKYNELINNS